MTNNKLGFLNGNALKIIAAVLMFIDHMGMLLFPGIRLFRIIGRLSMPIFAFMIAEGCKYTKNKLRYLLTISVLALIYQIAYYIYDGSTYMCILVTFSLSIIMIYALNFFKEAFFSKETPIYTKVLAALLFLLSVAGTYIFTRFFRVDYTIYGCMLPVFASLPHLPKSAPPVLKRLDCIPVSVITLGIGLFILSYRLGGIQMYSMLSLPLLFLYSGKRGKYKMKYFFYIFYPAHLLLLEAIALLRY